MSWFKRLFGVGEPQATAQPSEPVQPVQSRPQSPHSHVLATAPVPDLVDGLNALAAYYRYLEALAYDAGLNSVRDRREFRDEFLKRIADILEYSDDVSAADQIQFELQQEARVFGIDGGFRRDQDVARQARSIDLRGYDLMGLSAPLTTESLKTAYRNASKKYHPDLGGDTESMQIVNDAYKLFASLLNRQMAQDDSATAPQRFGFATADKFFRSVKMRRFALLIDDLAADSAYDAYKALDLQDVEEDYNGERLVARLCELLAASGCSNEASSVLHDLDGMTNRASARGLNYGPIYEKTSESCCDPKRIRFVPNHMRQAENLLRLGIIDQKRFDSVKKRIGDTEEKLADDSEAFTAFVRQHAFLNLPMDPPVDSIPLTGLVPGPDYYARVETMPEAQRREYSRAFHDGSPHLAMKYLAVRMDALLRAPFMGYRDVDAVLAEMKAIRSAPGITNLEALCDEGITVVSFLAQLSAAERKKRIDLLRRLDGAPGGITISISAGARMTGQIAAMPRPIFLNPEFTRFATGPLERIERYISTGSEHTVEEREQKRREWEASRAFYESPVYKNAQNAAWAKEKDPEAIVNAVSALCEEMYARIDSGSADVFEIGYWTDKLTIQLVKLRRFEEALRWLERFDRAPQPIRKRTGGGVANALEKRRGRCQAALKKGTAS